MATSATSQTPEPDARLREYFASRGKGGAPSTAPKAARVPAKPAPKVGPTRVPSAPACQPPPERDLTRLFNERSERVILGALIKDGARFDEAAGLEPGHFGIDSHREIFAAIQRLHKRGEGRDYQTVCNELGKRLAGIGGWSYVADLEEGLPRNPQIADHVRIVRKCAAARLAYKAAGALQAALEASDDPLQTIDQYRGQFDSAQELAAPDGDCGLRLLKGSEIEEQDSPMIVTDHIPDATIVGLIGPPGICKTTLAILIAADLSRGRTPYTGAPCPPRNILIMSNEDSPARIRKLFKAAGGDLSRLFVENCDDGWLLSDLSRLEKAIAAYNIGFVILDSFASHSGKADLNSHGETMGLLIPLRALAEKYHCAIVLIHHLNKSASADHLQRVSGSIGISASLRHSIHVAVDPDDPELRLLLNGKSNLCPPNVPALRFRPFPVGWAGESSITLQEIYQQPAVSEDSGAVDRAVPWLADALRPGAMAQRDLETLAKTAGHSWATVRRAKRALGVISRRSEFGGAWYWWLPESGAVQ